MSNFAPLQKWNESDKKYASRLAEFERKLEAGEAIMDSSGDMYTQKEGDTIIHLERVCGRFELSTEQDGVVRCLGGIGKGGEGWGGLLEKAWKVINS